MNQAHSESFVYEPMTIGAILDRGIRLSTQVFRAAFIPAAALAGIAMAIQLPKVQGMGLAVVLPVQFISGILAFIITIFFFILSSYLWRSEEVESSTIYKKIKFRLILRYLTVWLKVSFGMSLRGALFLLGPLIMGFGIPGIVAGLLCIIISAVLVIRYSIETFLSYYIVVVENLTSKEAIKQSIYLMSRESWFSLRGPAARATAIFIVIGILNVIAMIIVGGSTAAMATEVISRKILVVFGFFGALFQYYVIAVSAIFYAGFYYDLKARYEGADILSKLDKL